MSSWVFLAVQDSSIGDLVSHSVTHLLISASSEHYRAVDDNDYNDYNHYNHYNRYNYYKTTKTTMTTGTAI